jgi:hypothetical protein
MSFTTTLFNVRLTALSSLVVVLAALGPLVSGLLLPFCVPVPVQTHVLAV